MPSHPVLEDYEWQFMLVAGLLMTGVPPVIWLTADILPPIQLGAWSLLGIAYLRMSVLLHPTWSLTRRSP